MTDDNDVLADFRARMRTSPGRPGHSEVDLVSNDAEAEAAEAMADPDYEGDPGQIFSADDMIPKEFIQDSKKVDAILEKRRLEEIQARFPGSDLDFSREHGQVFGDIEEVGYHYSQDGKFFDCRGMEIEVPNVKRRKKK